MTGFAPGPEPCRTFGANDGKLADAPKGTGPSHSTRS